MVTFPMTLTDA